MQVTLWEGSRPHLRWISSDVSHGRHLATGAALEGLGFGCNCNLFVSSTAAAVASRGRWGLNPWDKPESVFAWQFAVGARRQGGEGWVKVRCLAVDRKCTESIPCWPRPGLKTYTHGPNSRVCESRDRAIGHLVENNFGAANRPLTELEGP